MYLVSVYLVSVGGDANTKFRSVFRLIPSKMPEHQVPLKDCFFFFFQYFYGFWPKRAPSSQKSQIYSTILHINSEKYRPDLALTLSLYLYGGLFLILHIKYWSTYLYGVIYA